MVKKESRIGRRLYPDPFQTSAGGDMPVQANRTVSETGSIHVEYLWGANRPNLSRQLLNFESGLGVGVGKIHSMGSLFESLVIQCLRSTGQKYILESPLLATGMQAPPMATVTSIAVVLHTAAQGTQAQTVDPWFWTTFGALGLLLNVYFLGAVHDHLRS